MFLQGISLTLMCALALSITTQEANVSRERIAQVDRPLQLIARLVHIVKTMSYLYQMVSFPQWKQGILMPHAFHQQDCVMQDSTVQLVRIVKILPSLSA